MGGVLSSSSPPAAAVAAVDAQCPPTKRRKISSPIAKEKTAFDVMLDSSKTCPSQSHDGAPSYIAILEIIAQNGWVPWHDDDTTSQNPTYSNLRLLCKDMKKFIDEPSNGGPDFDAIVSLLECKNGFDEDKGYCDHCFKNEGAGCLTCASPGNYQSCKCKKKHRYGNILTNLDPRLKHRLPPASMMELLSQLPLSHSIEVPSYPFHRAPLRQQAKELLQFLRKVAFNWHERYDKMLEKGGMDDGKTYHKGNLTNIVPDVFHPANALLNELKEYNEPLYNFMHHLLFTGWAAYDCDYSPGTYSPFRGQLLGEKDENGYYDCWNEGHGELFDEMCDSFIGLHKSEEEEVTVPSVGTFVSYTRSQIQYLPETIRRVVANCVDRQAEALLGVPIADSISLYRLVRETYESEKTSLSKIEWMPCLGVAQEDFTPLESFHGYNPHHERYGVVMNNIEFTDLTWVIEEGGEDRNV